ncbi:pyridoxamine 5'-phosphate oxidase family protein [Methylobacterium sp. JK268]
MAKRFEALEAAHRDFMARQAIFFVASAAPGSRVNLSPRGSGDFRCLDTRTVAYLDRTGSGNETAAHLRAGGRMTVMFCAFEGAPMILRLYGRGTVHGRRSATFAALLDRHFDGAAPLGTRQIVTLAVDLVQTSCGYGVPLFAHRGGRDSLDRWAAHKGEDGIAAYWRERNLVSLDGLPTGLLDEPEPPAAP